MDDVPEISNDRQCQCGYNLRGLTFDHRCPECGRPAAESVRFVVRVSPPHDEAERLRRDEVRRRLGAAAEGTPYAPNAILLLWGAWLYGRTRHLSPAGNSARTICEYFRTYARINRGGEARAISDLAKWGVRSSNDVGRMVYRLIDQQLLLPEDGDSIDDFAGLFTLANLFEAQL